MNDNRDNRHDKNKQGQTLHEREVLSLRFLVMYTIDEVNEIERKAKEKEKNEV